MWLDDACVVSASCAKLDVVVFYETMRIAPEYYGKSLVFLPA
jgi:hypothetical protein